MSFLGEPTPSEAQQKLYDDDLAEHGFVWDVSRMWAHQPELHDQLIDFINAAAAAAGLKPRDKAMLVLGTASTLGDSYCSVAWAGKLSAWADEPTVRSVFTGEGGSLSHREQALLGWARTIARDPNATTEADLAPLREVGFTDPQLLALTLYAGLRLGFSTTNDALGARPDVELAAELPPAVREVITWGRAPEPALTD